MKKVLVIDDSPDVPHLIDDMLSGHGYRVVSANNGLDGIEVARQHVPDLIICDLRMPKLDGFGTLSKLRENVGTATIPFIFLTGVTDKPEMRHGMELGADDYLTKPFTSGELLAAVQTRLDKKAVLTREAEKKLEELRGNISMALPHELLTPLAGILGFSSLLAEEHETLSPAEIADTARSIHESSLRLRRTIENFLLYSQLELYAADPDRTGPPRKGEFWFTPESLFAPALTVARRAGREADLKTELEGGILSVPSDKVEKIIHELMDNAFKFSKPGTPVRFSSVLKSGFLVLRFEDKGRGMTAEQIARVGGHMQFERKFYEQQGSGLGLVIARRLAEFHGGALTLESEAGRGTVVEVSLPLK